LHYGKAVYEYIPQAYAGRVTLLRHDVPAGADRDLGWRAVAADLALYTIPVDHISCLTDHIQALAGCLNACQREAHGVPAAGRA
jgi:hypothetical protein